MLELDATDDDAGAVLKGTELDATIDELGVEDTPVLRGTEE